MSDDQMMDPMMEGEVAGDESLPEEELGEGEIPADAPEGVDGDEMM